MYDFIKKTIRIGKIIFIVIAVYFVIIGLFIRFTRKDFQVTNNSSVHTYRNEIYKIINNKEYSKTKQGKKIVSLYQAFSCSMMGEACTNNPADGDKNYGKSVFGGLSKLIILPLTNPPASGIYWTYTGLQSAGFVSKTYAAEGIGFASLKPMMNLWKAFRDLSYMLLVLVLIAIGFMVMFRMKLNPQTVISAENALPRIIISLILITFSFAIAGFLIDFMYILITLGIAVISNKGNFYDIPTMQNKFLNADFSVIFTSMFPSKPNPGGIPFVDGWAALSSVGNAFINILPDFVNQILRHISATAFTLFIYIKLLFDPLTKITESVDAITGGLGFGGVVALVIKILLFLSIPVGYAIGYAMLLPLVIMVLISLTIMGMFFRLFFLLFATYLRILLLVVFSPVFMLFEAIPGKNPFSYWFRHILAEILVFPILILFLVITYVIVNTPATTGNLWQPPFLTEFNPNTFTTLLGFGLMFQIPEFIKLIKELIGAKDMPIGLNLGTFFGGAAGVGGGVMGAVGGIGSLSLGAGAIIKMTGVKAGSHKGLLGSILKGFGAPD